MAGSGAHPSDLESIDIESIQLRAPKLLVEDRRALAEKQDNCAIFRKMSKAQQKIVWRNLMQVEQPLPDFASMLRDLQVLQAAIDCVKELLGIEGPVKTQFYLLEIFSVIEGTRCRRDSVDELLHFAAVHLYDLDSRFVHRAQAAHSYRNPSTWASFAKLAQKKGLAVTVSESSSSLNDARPTHKKHKNKRSEHPRAGRLSPAQCAVLQSRREGRYDSKEAGDFDPRQVHACIVERLFGPRSCKAECSPDLRISETLSPRHVESGASSRFSEATEFEKPLPALPSTDAAVDVAVGFEPETQFSMSASIVIESSLQSSPDSYWSITRPAIDSRSNYAEAYQKLVETAWLSRDKSSSSPEAPSSSVRQGSRRGTAHSSYGSVESRYSSWSSRSLSAKGRHQASPALVNFQKGAKLHAQRNENNIRFTYKDSHDTYLYTDVYDASDHSKISGDGSTGYLRAAMEQASSGHCPVRGASTRALRWETLLHAISRNETHFFVHVPCEHHD